MRLTLYSIGHSTRPIEKFVGVLKAHSVALLVDIRTIPRSRHNPQFNTEELKPSLEAAGIGYLHMKELGGLRHPARDSRNTGWRNESFRGYADYMETDDFEEALERLTSLAETSRVAIMCAEGNPFRCHRSLVADALTVRGARVLEISSARPGRQHRLTSFAKVRGLRIIYAGEPGSDSSEGAKKE